MTLDEAIEHCSEIIAKNGECVECINEHIQLRSWLEELKELREFKENILKCVNGEV